MSENSKVDFSVLQPFKSFDTVKIGDYEWPLYPLTFADVAEGEILQFGQRFSDGSLDPSNMSTEFLQAVSRVLWVLLRKGVPGMTVDGMVKAEWSSTPETIMQMIPFMLDGEMIVTVLLAKHGFMSTEAAINPLPASPSAVPVAGGPAKGRTRASKLAG